MVARWTDDEVLRMGPLPFRIAFIGAGAAVCRFLGEYTPFALALVSLAGGVLLVVAGMLLARRWVVLPGGVVIAGILLATSPLATGLSRRGLQDSCFAALVVFALWVLDRFLESRKAREAWGLGAVLLLGFLTKETMAFIYPMLLALFIVRQGHKQSKGLAHLAGALVAAPGVATAIFAVVAGSVGALLSTYSSYSAMQRTIPYALAFQGGPWFRYVVDFVLVSPLVVLLAVGGLALGRKAVDRSTLPAAAVILVGLATFTFLPLKNLRIVLFLDVPLRILAAGAIVSLCDLLGDRPRLHRVGLAAITAGVVLVDLLLFARIFVAAGVYDPITANLVKALGFAP